MTDATDPIDDTGAGEASEDTDAAYAADTDDTDDACAADDDADTDAQREFKKNARDALRKFLKPKRRGGADFCSLLLLLFIGLKLTGHIDWSWVWVLSPFWIRAAFRLAMVALAITLMKKLGWKPSGKT